MLQYATINYVCQKSSRHLLSGRCSSIPCIVSTQLVHSFWINFSMWLSTGLHNELSLVLNVLVYRAVEWKQYS